ncbi:hypothetical protein LCGC14_1645220 [marine sediment metagenome]|uniref:Uncharacterized protein n=1 Tax=marine sediment metagenome TaxID=412755 RepID=A0A0F9KYA7_9ZZZZ
MKLSGANITVPLARRIVGLPGHKKSSFNRCVGGQLTGTHGNYAARIENFTKAAKSCKGK